MFFPGVNTRCLFSVCTSVDLSGGIGMGDFKEGKKKKRAIRGEVKKEQLVMQPFFTAFAAIVVEKRGA